ncbi:adenylate/guanylate cyclase domain-containing protein [Microvirga sp. HBU67558]|uniref:adenylate/guanylate cyclase domain-containing protein n=1 Tax=Microvirga TaxID=186650 RepID=UPI001B367780|nr:MULTISPECIES: adenylate/guanylate cyclase domain-containing protein [unclassified Microvirga]MBQ0820191.1 adenylate/guanylate cyclase domain-containing protein [Microvirga sp. HBU67558]
MANLEDWIIEQGLRGADVGSLLSGFTERLVAEGLPLVRVYLALPTVNPTIRVYTHVWTRSAGLMVEGVSHERNARAFDRSPFNHMMQTEQTRCYWLIDDPAAPQFDVFDDVRRQGGTDYLARLFSFENESAPDLRGIGLSFSSDRPDGFRPEEVERIDSLLPLLGLAAYRMTLFDLTVAMLDTYVGLSAGRRVLSGEIRRGFGTTITAALLFADLRGFTSLADTAGMDLIARLDQHLEAMADPVAEQGGEVLKFMGDGILAAFPITDERSREQACAAAIRAARTALERNVAVNALHAGEPPLSLDVALHCGDVFYGNIGAAGRLDFTVIGPAVNEVSRMEALCNSLDCSVVVSESVASASPVALRSLGRHRLRGIAAERELFTLDPVSVWTA